MQVYTYGCPYPGNHAFCQDYERLVPDTWHVVLQRDPIPRAGKLLGLFKRPGYDQLISSGLVCASLFMQRP